MSGLVLRIGTFKDVTCVSQAINSESESLYPFKSSSLGYVKPCTCPAI